MATRGTSRIQDLEALFLLQRKLQFRHKTQVCSHTFGVAANLGWNTHSPSEKIRIPKFSFEVEARPWRNPCMIRILGWNTRSPSEKIRILKISFEVEARILSLSRTVRGTPSRENFPKGKEFFSRGLGTPSAYPTHGKRISISYSNGVREPGLSGNSDS
jgi:hypothetical protein